MDMWKAHSKNYHKFYQNWSDLMVSRNNMGLLQIYRCIRPMGQEKFCNRNRERKTTNSKRQEFQYTSTKCQKSEVRILQWYRTWDKWLYWSERSSKTWKNCEFKEVVLQLSQKWSSRSWLFKPCFQYSRKHHTPLYVNNQLQGNSNNIDQEGKENMMASFGEKSLCYHIAIVNANGIQFWILIGHCCSK